MCCCSPVTTQGDSIEVANVAILLHGTMKAVSGDEVESGCVCVGAAVRHSSCTTNRTCTRTHSNNAS